MGTRPANRREIVLATAARLFADRGFNGVSVDQLCAEVGMTGPALYRHFRGKDALLDAVLQLGARTLRASVPESAGEGGTSGLVTRLAHALTNTVLAHPHEVVTLLREGQHASPERREDVRAALEEATAALGRWLGLIHPGFPAEQVASRGAAILGGISEIGRRRLADGSRLGQLACGAAQAMILAPPAKQGPPTAAAPAWKAAASRHDAILAAALERFGAVGYGGTSMDDIAVAAGISLSTLYRDYPTKADILVDAYDLAAAKTRAGALQALAGARDAADALDRLLRSLIDIVTESLQLLVVTAREAATLPPDQLGRIARGNRAFRQAWAGVIRELRPELEEDESELLARGAIALAMHTLNLAPGSRDRPEEVVALARAFVLGPVQAEDGAAARATSRAQA